MCEFCSRGPNSKSQDRDAHAHDPFSFGGFFSPDAINEAVRLSKQLQKQTKNSNNGSSNEEKEEVSGEEDDDGT